MRLLQVASNPPTIRAVEPLVADILVSQDKASVKRAAIRS